MAIELEERPHWRFSLDDYHRLIEAGVLGEDDRVELIEGELLAMSPIGPEHAAAVLRLNHRLSLVLGDRALVSSQNPVSLWPTSEPQPDVLVLTYHDDYYATAHPGPGDVHLVVEVADSSVLFDRNHKLPLYGRSGIREAWLVDLVNGLVVVATEPGRDGYGSIVEHRAGATIAPAAFPDVTVDVADLLR